MSNSGDVVCQDVIHGHPSPGTAQVSEQVVNILFSQLPLELVMHVCSLSRPMDLLALGRTDKRTRKLVMSKDWKKIWASAEQVLGVPPCPSDLVNPAYASLLFERHCMSCGTTTGTRLVIFQRVRLCKDCRATEMVRVRDVDPSAKSTKVTAATALLGGSLSYALARTRSWFKRDRKLPIRQFYYKPRLLEKLAEYDTQVGRPRDYVHAKAIQLFHMRRHTEDVLIFLSQERDKRWIETSKIKDERERTIKEYLISSGYCPSDFNTEDDKPGWTWFRLLRAPRPLTDEEWIRILPELEETIAKRNERKAEIARQKVLDNRFRRVATLSLRYFSTYETPCLVTPKDLRSNEVVTRVLNEKGSGVLVVHRKWHEIESELKKLSAQMKEKIIKHFLSITLTAIHGFDILETMSGKVHYSNEDAVWEVLDSPYAFFKVGRSGFYSPRGMISELSRIIRGMYEPEGMQFEFDDVVRIIETNDEVVRIARFLSDQRIVPHASTMEDMDDEGQAFLCRFCRPTQRVILTWRELVTHIASLSIEYERAQKTERWVNVNNKLPGFHFDHDWRRPGFQAFYYVPTEGADDSLEESCSCSYCLDMFSDGDDDSDVTLSNLGCHLCRMMGIQAYIYCPREQDAHANAVHMIPNYSELVKELQRTGLTEKEEMKLSKKPLTVN